MARILFVDEEQGRLQALRDHLEMWGSHEMIPALDPQEALTAIETEGGDLDLIILDIMLPLGEVFSKEEATLGLRTGVLLLRRIQEQLPSVPVLVLTGVNSEPIRREILDLGLPPERYLRKPVGGTELLARVQAILGGRA